MENLDNLAYFAMVIGAVIAMASKEQLPEEDARDFDAYLRGLSEKLYAPEIWRITERGNLPQVIQRALDNVLLNKRR